MILRFLQTTFLVLGFATMACAQQVASTDLLRSPAAATPATPAQTPEESDHPNGCSKMGVGFADGVTLDEDRKPRKLMVGLVEISTSKLTIGSEVIATAKLQNIGGKSLQIPWSTDFRTTMDGQDPDNRSWEVAEFRMSIRDKKNPHYYDRLVITSQPLYASKFVPGSYLTIEPGRWITARISFRIAVQRPAFEKLSVGTNTLAMEWFQTVRTRKVKDCGVTLGYFPYDDPFGSVNRSEVAQVQIEGPVATTRPAP
jgi:hypothetical protein